MKKGGSGGANTKTGLVYEGKIDLVTFLSKQDGYKIKNGTDILYNDKYIGSSFKKYGLYRYLESKGIDYKQHITRRLLPDDALFIIKENTLFILEIKSQETAGSTDEKLQTCDFKIKQYRKLLSTLNMEVEYIYILNDWFKKQEYKDVLDYIISIKGCSYYFDYLPLQKIGLPISK